MNWLQKISDDSMAPNYTGVGHGYRWDSNENKYKELWQHPDREPVILWYYENGKIREEMRDASNRAHWSDKDNARGRVETGTGRGSVVFDGPTDAALQKRILEELIDKYPGIKFGIYERGGPYNMQQYWEILESGQI